MKESIDLDDNITHAIFLEWSNHPVTKFIRDYIVTSRDNALELLLNGSPSASTNHPLIIEGERKGRINAYNALLSINYNLVDKLKEYEELEYAKDKPISK